MPFPKASQLGPSIRLLLKLGISDGRLGGLLGTSAPNIRQIASRDARREVRSYRFPDITKTLAAHDAGHDDLEYLRGLGPRIVSSKELHRLEEIGIRIEEQALRYRNSLDFEGGAAHFAPYISLFAHVRRPPLLALRSRIHFHIAWFFTHIGFARSSLTHAALAMQMSRAAYQEALGDPHYLPQYAESALVASNSLLLSHRPLGALTVLNAADAAFLATGTPLGSEHHRQRGVALFQMEKDSESESCFEQAREAMRIRGEARDEKHVLVLGTRQSNFLAPGQRCEAAQEHPYLVAGEFGQVSLEYVVALTWAAATAMITDSATAVRAMLEKLHAVDPTLLTFRHQATRIKLLSIAPELKLSPGGRSKFLRFALYENASRKR